MKNPDELDDIPIPQAKPDFQNRLEESLIARMKEKGEKKMDAVIRLKSPRFSSIMPLIAAALTLFIIISLFSLMSRPPSPLNVNPVVNLQPTSTPMPVVRIVVAARFIHRGQPIEEDDLMHQTWPEAMTPLSAMTDMSHIVGRYALTDIYRNSPIQGNIIDTKAPDGGTPLTTEGVNIAVAIQPIVEGQTITSDMVGLRTWPAYALPPRAFTDLNELIGRKAWTNIYREQPITLAMVSDEAVIGVVPVVTTNRPIERGQILRRTMLTVTMWREDQVPENAVAEVSEVIGQVAINNIPAYLPVVSTDIAVDRSELNVPSIVLPAGTRMISIPVGNRALALSIQQGNRLDVYVVSSGSGIVFATQPTEDSHLLVANALVSYVGEFPLDSQSSENAPTLPPASNEEFSPLIISLAVTPQEAVALTVAVEAGTPLIITRHPSFSLQEGDVLFNLPLTLPDNLLNAETRLEVGDTVDIVVALLFADTDREGQTVTPNLRIERITRGAQVAAVNNEEITLAVSPQEKVTLDYFKDSNVPMILIPMKPQETAAANNRGTAPMITSSPMILCQVVAVNEQGVILRDNPTTTARRAAVLPFGTAMDVLSQQRGENDNNVWFYVSVQTDEGTQPVEGWVREDNVRMLNLSVCPPLEEAPQEADAPTPTITLIPTATDAQVEIVRVEGAGDVTAEQVLIRNNGRVINLNGWTLSDAEGNTYIFAERNLFTNGEITIRTGEGEDTSLILFWDQTAPIFGEPRDVAVLKNADGEVQAILRLPS